MRYRVRHTTVYEYADPVALCHNLLHLEPRPHPRQTCADYELTVEPAPAVVRRHVDYYGNPVAYVAVQQPHRRLALAARFDVDVAPPPPIEDAPPWEAARDALRDDPAPAVRAAVPFVFDSPYVPRTDPLAAYAAPSFPPGRPLLVAVRDLTRRIHREFRYDPAATTVATPVGDVLAHRGGVCQDFAHVQLGALRSLGLAARYVSGYLVTRPPAGQPRLVGADASHAWLSVFCPVNGWVDFDPTNDQRPADRHVTLAWGRDYDDISPVRGIVLGGGPHTLHVAVDVAPA